jgi:hypothetical protein
MVSGLLWVVVIAPIIAQAFGVPLQVGLWRGRRHNEQLNKREWILVSGVFGWGIGMFLFSTAFDFLDWRLLGDDYSRLRLRHIGFRLITWLIAGVVFGLLTSLERKVARGDNN